MKQKTISIILIVVGIIEIMMATIIIWNSKSIYFVPDDEIQYISMVDLIANPDKYNGKLVQVEGVGSINFEDMAVYLSPYDYEYGTRNSIWLEMDLDYYDDATFSEMVHCNGKYVIVEGIFNKDNTGHMSAYSGALEQISRYELTWAEQEKENEQYAN